MLLREFIATLARELRRRGIAYDRRTLEVFAASVWPLAQDDPEDSRWTAEFLATMRTGDYAA